MRRRLITAILAAILAAVPLMGAKSCGTGSGTIIGQGHQFRGGDGEVFWVGETPPHPLIGTKWKPNGYTRRGIPVWERVRR